MTTTKKGTATPKVAMRKLPQAVVSATQALVGAKTAADRATNTLTERKGSVGAAYYDAGITAEMLSKQNKEKREAMGVTKAKLHVETFNAAQDLIARSCLTEAQYKLWCMPVKGLTDKQKERRTEAASRVTGYMGELRRAVKARWDKADAGLDPEQKHTYTPSEREWIYTNKQIARLQNDSPELSTSKCGSVGVPATIAMLRKARDCFAKPSHIKADDIA